MTRNSVVAAGLGRGIGEAADIAPGRGAVRLVEDAERRELEPGRCRPAGQRGEGLFAAGEEQDVLQLLARGRGHDVDAGFGGVLLVGEAHEGLGHRRRAWRRRGRSCG